MYTKGYTPKKLVKKLTQAARSFETLPTKTRHCKAESKGF
jgi:hypothetical protein